MAWFLGNNKKKYLEKLKKANQEREEKASIKAIGDISPEQKEQRARKVEIAKEEKKLEEAREKRKEEDKATEDQLLIVNGAKIKMGPHMGSFKVLSDVPTTQGKLTGTVVEKSPANFSFNDGFQLLSLTEWQDVGTIKYQDNKVLIKKSKIIATGKMPGNTPPETAPIEFTDSGQINVVESIDTDGIPVPSFEEPAPQYIINFRRPYDYQGEFGFDWMRKEYLPINEGGQGFCVEGLEELKKIYTPFKVDLKHSQTQQPYGDYYVPWLIMFPNHKQKIGKEVQLLVTTPQEYQDNSLFNSTEVEEFSLETSNPALRIEPSKLNIDDCLNGVVITIYCDAPLQNNETITAVASNGAIVGKVNVMRNAHYRDLTVNIYVIKSYLTDQNLSSDFGKNVIDNKLSEIGNLQVIEDYLNKKSLNQALIQVKFIEINQNTGEPFDWGFRKISLENASKEEKYKGMFNSSTKIVEASKYMNYINDRFGKMFPSIAKSKGILLYLSSIKTTSSGGAAYTLPLDNKHCIIFNSNLNHLSSYAHEIGHTIGLAHTFPEEQNVEQKIQNAENDLKNYKEKQEREKNNKNEYLRRYSDYLDKNPNKKREAVEILDKNIDQYNNAIKSLEEKITILKNNRYKFKEKATENILDYDLNNQKTFTQWQIKIMQEEVQKYYH
ncbi:hypothetical protein EQP59_02080 [Ornithobacterium rhinotracheale]|uniref:Uncharacterized protein n=1 Tax=Ornithobacterium rhinotracheale TaxID=28251 RepID=A0A410JQE4_ORNRH|nr:hypothetical protein [Ornithobacterium rhinotracheale]QAR30228.1 hypothetical protein EQP59_02080 [Ornithobacterium rhinotracheale]